MTMRMAVGTGVGVGTAMGMAEDMSMDMVMDVIMGMGTEADMGMSMGGISSSVPWGVFTLVRTADWANSPVFSWSLGIGRRRVFLDGMMIR